jgi:hypothetical protein
MGEKKIDRLIMVFLSMVALAHPVLIAIGAILSSL